MRENILKIKSYAFVLRIVNLYKYLFSLKECVLLSGMVIDALVSETDKSIIAL